MLDGQHGDHGNGSEHDEGEQVDTGDAPGRQLLQASGEPELSRNVDEEGGSGNDADQHDDQVAGERPRVTACNMENHRENRGRERADEPELDGVRNLPLHVVRPLGERCDQGIEEQGREAEPEPQVQARLPDHEALRSMR